MTTPPQKSYRKIKLTRGKYALVDCDQHDRLCQYKYIATWNIYTYSWYAYRSAKVDGHRVQIGMHRDVLGLTHGDKRQGDHIKSGHTLDNRSKNLRIATSGQNKVNSRPKSSRTNSKYRGVVLHKSGLWGARIGFEGKRFSLKYHKTEELAHAAYREAATRLYGEFARFD